MRCKSCISITVLLLSILIGSLWYITPLRAFVWYCAYKAEVPLPDNLVETRRIYIPSKQGEVQLQTDHYFPLGANLSAPHYPTILIRTPYGLDHHHGLAVIFFQISAYYLATQGYNVVFQNVRGRYGSSGEYNPFLNEKEDGHATLKWLKEQTWFNGKLGTAGLSYLGYTQYVLFGKDAPIQISAAVPILSSPNFYNIGHNQGSPFMDVILPWNFMMDKFSKKEPKFPEADLDMISYFREFSPLTFNMTLHVPLIEADSKYFRKKITSYRDMLTNVSQDDEYWKLRDARPLLAEVEPEVVHLVGAWYDLFIRDTLETYNKLVKMGKKPYLTIFPLDHGHKKTGFFASPSIAWFNYKLKGDKSLLRSRPVSFFINPTLEQMEVDAWPPKTTDLTFYLQTKGKIGDAKLEENLEETYQYTFDPVDPLPILGGNILNGGGIEDNFEFFAKRKSTHNDFVLFSGFPLPKDIVITGNPHVKLWVSSSIPHSDFCVRLLDYDPTTNVSLNICDGFIRLTDAKSEFFEIDIELDPTAYKVQKGHSIMLSVASSAHPHYTRNPGTGVHLSIATEFLKADRKVAVSSIHSSQIILPVMV